MMFSPIRLNARMLALIRILLILLQYMLCTSRWNCKMLAAVQLLPGQQVSVPLPGFQNCTNHHCCQIPPGLLGQFSQKIRPLEKKLGRKPSTPQITGKGAVKNFCYKFLAQFLPLIVKIRPQIRKFGVGQLSRPLTSQAARNFTGPFLGPAALNSAIWHQCKSCLLSHSPPAKLGRMTIRVNTIFFSHIGLFFCSNERNTTE